MQIAYGIVRAIAALLYAALVYLAATQQVQPVDDRAAGPAYDVTPTAVTRH